MLGNDYVYGTCPLGNNILNKISLIRGSKGNVGNNPDLDAVVLSNAKLLRGINFTSTRDYTVLQTDRGAIVDKNSYMFQPESLDLMVYSLESIDYLKRFIRSNISNLVMKLEFDTKTLFCDVIFDSDSIEIFTVLDKWSIRFLRTSMYYTIKKYDFYNDYDSYSSGTYIKDIVNAGDVQGDIQVFLNLHEYEGIKITQIYGGNASEVAFNSLELYKPYVASAFPSEIKYSSVIGDYYIREKIQGYPDYTDISTYREFTSKGYITIGQGDVELRLEGLSKSGVYTDEYLEVFIYEYYHNI